MPYPRNPFFTGREQVLERLHAALTSSGTAALSGLGGIGKTQTAIEYAYRHREDCKAVFWAKADSRDALLSGFVAIAGLLDLPEKDAQDQNLAVAAVKRWLETNTNWLLVLDNADDLVMAREFIPTGRKGHILLTTRAQATGAVARRIELAEMGPKEGALFLLRRAKILAQDEPLDAASAPDRAKAEDIVRAMGGLPFALDQTGAYIEETPSSLEEYLELYKQEGAKLLAERGELAPDHPSVVVAFSLAFEQVADGNPAAADLLRVCAFLAPDAIPEEIFAEGAAELGEHLGPVVASSLEFAKAIKEAGRFSLIDRNPANKALDIHRLVQEVLKEEMDEATQCQWAERTVRAVNCAFPGVEFSVWQRCERLLPHAQACAELISIEKWDLEFPEAARLLNQAGFYLHEHARYTEAEPLYRRALAIREKVLEPEHPDVAQSLNNLALLYHAQGKYAKAEPLYRRALAIWEKVLEPEHPNVTIVLDNYSSLLRKMNRKAEAAQMEARATVIRTKHAQENPTE